MQSDSNFGDTIFWTESITQQVFLLNRRILQDDSLRAIPLAFCDPVGGQVKAEVSRYCSSIDPLQFC